jgi:hypothetical protein
LFVLFFFFSSFEPNKNSIAYFFRISVTTEVSSTAGLMAALGVVGSGSAVAMAGAR